MIQFILAILILFGVGVVYQMDLIRSWGFGPDGAMRFLSVGIIVFVLFQILNSAF